MYRLGDMLGLVESEGRGGFGEDEEMGGFVWGGRVGKGWGRKKVVRLERGMVMDEEDG